MSYLVSFCSCVFSPFSIAITSLGEERANLSAFRTFVRFVICLDLSVSSSSWCLGRDVVCDFGTPWTFLLPFFFTWVYIIILSSVQKHRLLVLVRTASPGGISEAVLTSTHNLCFE